MSQAQASNEAVRRIVLSQLLKGETDVDAILGDRKPMESLGRLIRRLGIAEDDVAARALSDATGLKLVGADAFDGPVIFPEHLNPRFLDAIDATLLPNEDGHCVLAVADPDVQRLAGGLGVAAQMPVTTVVAPLRLIERAKSQTADSRGSRPTLADGAEPDDDDNELHGDNQDAPVVRLVQDLILGAARARASDLHIEPYPDRLRVRLRIDGVLHDWRTLSPRMTRVVVSRIKIMASLDIAERRLPQDGRTRIDVDGTRFDLRVATLPASHGEGIVIRFLRDSFADISLETIGIEGADLARVRRALASPFGLILVVGPTGAGKSTTLAGALSERNQPGVKIISIEDPVEYQIDGVTQIAVKPTIGLSFASALRAILRNDPDVIVVGELRDAETAEMATNAALTGHLVLATLHANDVAGTVPRLLDLGVDPSLIRSVLRLAIAQRLVRKLCSACKRMEADSYVAVGCSRCEQTGYAGRTGVFEILEIDEASSALIKPGCSSIDFWKLAAIDGVSGLRASALVKVQNGATSIAEMQRVLGLD